MNLLPLYFLALLNQSPEAPMPAVPKQLLPLVQGVALQIETMDRRECGYLLHSRIGLEGDWSVMRERTRRLKDAPRLSEAGRFPERDAVCDLISFNRSYRKHLELVRSVDLARFADYTDALSECDQLYGVWDAVRDSTCEHYYVSVRREALLRLRDLIGQEAFGAGLLPPYVPVWRFRQR